MDDKLNEVAIVIIITLSRLTLKRRNLSFRLTGRPFGPEFREDAEFIAIT